MPRPRYRATLESGLKLDLNRLVRRGIVRPGGFGAGQLNWSWTYTGELIAVGMIEAMMEPPEGWLRIRIGRRDQRISLVAHARRFGGHQWYFRCPVTGRLASVVWRPPGAQSFASRHAWGGQVAYASQFETWHGRALTMAQKLRTRLAGAEWAALDGDDPPKPKGMRWRTYERIMARADRYEAIADRHLISLVNQWGW